MSNTDGDDDVMTHIVVTAWSDQMLRAMRITTKAQAAAQAAYDEQIAWLRASLTDDHAPQWLVDLIITNWQYVH